MGGKCTLFIDQLVRCDFVERSTLDICLVRISVYPGRLPIYSWHRGVEVTESCYFMGCPVGINTEIVIRSLTLFREAHPFSSYMNVSVPSLTVFFHIREPTKHLYPYLSADVNVTIRDHAWATTSLAQLLSALCVRWWRVASLPV